MASEKSQLLILGGDTEEENEYNALRESCSECVTDDVDKDVLDGDTMTGSTLRSRRRHLPSNDLQDQDDPEDISTISSRLQVPDTPSTSSSSSSPSLREDENNDEDESEDLINSLNFNTIRLNQVCEAACVDILIDWENILTTNNNVESKTLPLSSSTTNGDGENETDHHTKTASGRLQFSTLSRDGSVPRNQLYLYAQFAKDLVEVLIFAVILLGLVYAGWMFARFWYMRTTRNSQDAIYPVLRTMRFTSLAFLFNYPNAQELYEEACILQNPFYEMNDVSCWPCENVRHMLDFTGFSNFTSGYYQSGIPFIVKDALEKGVLFEDIFKLLKDDPISNLTSTAHILSNHPGVETFDQFFELTRKKDSHHLSGRGIHLAWKVNRAQYARLMRTLFQRPYYIPQETEISVQHFLFIDEPDSESYPLPITEFANVFLMQGDGPRLVVLVPVRHCQKVCKPIRVLLEPRDVLYYNWLFWRPIITPVKAAGIKEHSLSITYMGSFY